MLTSGRSFPAGRMWGLIEKNLVDVIPAIWEDVLASPESDLNAILDRHITPLAEPLAADTESVIEEPDYSMPNVNGNSAWKPGFQDRRLT